MSEGGRLPRGERWLWWLLVTVIATQTALNLCRPLISYRSIALGADAFAVGLITAAYALLSLVVAVPLGRLSDRIRRVAWLVAVGIALLALAPLLLAASRELVTVAVSSAVLGLGHITFMVAGQGLVARRSAEHMLDRNFGWFTAAASLGQLLGPLLAGGLLTGASSDEALEAATVRALCVASLIAALGLPAIAGLRSSARPRARARPSEEPPASLPLARLLRRPGMPAGLLTSLALLAAVDLLTAYLPLIAEERGISPTVVGALLAIRAAASILSRLLVNQLLNRWSRRLLISCSTFGSAVATGVVALPPSGPVVMGVALALGGFLLGLGQPLTMTMVVQAVPFATRGTALSLRLWGNRMGQVALPAGAALVAGTTGAAGALWFSCAILLAAAKVAFVTAPRDGDGAP